MARMTSAQIDQMRRNAEDTYKRTIANIERLALEVIDTPEEPPYPSTVRFDVQYNRRGGTVYTYWASRFLGDAGDRKRWVISGQGGRFTWEEIVDLMSEDWDVKDNGVKPRFTILVEKD